MKIFSSRGQSLVELLVTIGIAAILVPALFSGFMTSRSGKAQLEQRIDATSILKQAVEAVRVTRENSWSNVATNGTYHPVINGTTWSLATGSATTNGYTTQVVVGDVYRNNGAIVSNGGTLDTSTKKVTISVSWGTPLPTAVSSTLYFARYVNTTYTETSLADFNDANASKSGVTVTNVSGGEVVLGAGGGGDWCAPNLSIASYDLPGQGITTSISAIQGHAYTTTGYNASGNSMDSVNISNTKPPVASNGGSYNNFKTYGIFADTSYVYLTSNHPGLTVDIVQVTSSPYTQVGTFNASGGGNGQSVYVSGTTGYVTAGSYLYAFDLTSKNGARTQLGRIALAGTGNKVIVVGSYAYVVTSSTTTQLQIINVSNPASMSIVSNINVNNNQGGVDVFVNTSGTFAYLVTTYTSGSPDFFIIDVSNKASPVLKGTYSTNGMTPKGVTVVPGNRAIIVGSGGEQYQVLNITSVTSPTRCGGLTNPDSSTSINAIASVLENDGDAYSYILTDNASQELQIIEGGPGGQYAASGTFTSRPFNVGSEVSFNRFNTTFTQPAQTTIQFQVAVEHANNGSCTTGVNYSFVGPDGTANTKFTTGSMLPLSNDGTGYENPGQCLKYKAFLNSTDTTQTPELDDITFNYSL